MTKETILTAIAKSCLGIDTLERRNRDGLDFHDVSVWAVKDALETAFAAGQLTTQKQHQKLMLGGGGYMAAFEANYDDIVSVFGEPTGGDGFKTEAEWNFLMPRNQAVRIYNYKSSRSYGAKYPDVKEVTRWHIGGKSRALVDKVIAMMGGKAKLVHRQGE
jgi:hypothetical protein